MNKGYLNWVAFIFFVYLNVNDMLYNCQFERFIHHIIEINEKTNLLYDHCNDHNIM